MTNDQIIAARRVLNPYRATIKLDVTLNDDGSEILTPYLTSSPQTRGPDVTIRTETPVVEVGISLATSINSLL